MTTKVYHDSHAVPDGRSKIITQQFIEIAKDPQQTNI